MIIELTQEGLSLQNIPDNPLIAFGMLKMAEQAVAEFFAKKNSEQRIQPAIALPPGLRIKG